MLLRVQAIVEEAEGRHITNHAMLQQLQMLREAMLQRLVPARYFQENEHGISSREPYSKYLFMEKCMFGRQAEMENIISFLLQPEPPGAERLPVLPIVVDTLATITAGNGVVKKQINGSRGRSLIVMELAEDFVLDKWQCRKLNSSRSHMPPGSKLIITSRSESILKHGTSEPIRLKFLPQEAYWYFFKVMAFGSTNPEVHPELASIAMELAEELDGSFLVANIISGLLRADIQSRSWRKFLELHKNHVKRNMDLFGEHPHTLLYKKNQVAYVWCLTSISMRLKVQYRDKLYHPNEVPKLTLHDVMTGSAEAHGKFDVVAWKSCIPPYDNYLMSCEIEAPQDMKKAKKKRPHFMV
ncbi:hypothetical protein EJB05_17169, partial [Eragrostis curvula]